VGLLRFPLPLVLAMSMSTLCEIANEQRDTVVEAYGLGSLEKLKLKSS
jgi:hypothetical protein